MLDSVISDHCFTNQKRLEGRFIIFLEVTEKVAHLSDVYLHVCCEVKLFLELYIAEGAFRRYQDFVVSDAVCFAASISSLLRSFRQRENEVV